ncbi:hypothetical protein ACLOJK_028612, partial [Asimina triloba]
MAIADAGSGKSTICDANVGHAIRKTANPPGSDLKSNKRDHKAAKPITANPFWVARQIGSSPFSVTH